MMKRNTFLALMLSCLAGSQAFAASASPNDCDSNAAHCAYTIGLSQNQNHGRFIKTTYDTVDAGTLCTIDSWNEILQEDAVNIVGNHTDHYYICKDASGKDCELVGTDSYTILKSNGKYSSTPLKTPIDFSSVVNNYPDCHASDMKRLRYSR